MTSSLAKKKKNDIINFEQLVIFDGESDWTRQLFAEDGKSRDFIKTHLAMHNNNLFIMGSLAKILK